MKKLGLFIGVDRYTDQNITPLQCAARDARELARQFHRLLGFETTVLTHDELLQGRRVMDELLRIEGKLSAGDVFVLFFAGHGKALSKHGEKSDQLFLLPHASTRILEKGIVAGEGVLSYQMIRAETDGWRGVQRAFIFDACRLPLEVNQSRDASNAARFDGEAVYRGIALGGPHEDDEALASAPLVILNSCHDEQRAEELNNYGHGLFTGSLLEVLAEYEQAQQSVIINENLIHDLAKRMQKLAREHGKRDTTQRPLRLGSALTLKEASAAPHVHAAIPLLLQHFERQFAAKQYTRPVGDNCQATLEKISDQGHSAPELNQRLQVALDQLETEEKRRRDQQKFDAASAIHSVEAYADYLKTCELCEQKEQAKVAIAGLKAATPHRAEPLEPVPVKSRLVEPVQTETLAIGGNNAKRIWQVGGAIGLVLVLLWIGYQAWTSTSGSEVSPAPASAPAEPPASTPSPAAAPAEPAINQQLAAKATFQDKLSDGTAGPMMVVLPSGRFQMGSDLQDDEKNGPLVTIAQKFAIGKYEVTNAEYQACVKAKACKEPEWNDVSSEYHLEKNSHYKRLGAALTGAQFPAVGVSWHNAKEYVAWLNANKQDKQGEYSLPSEAQWEYAARATTANVKTKWAHGDDEALLQNYAWYDKNSGGKTHQVGTLQPNDWGLYDMHGNVWEWVEDCYQGSYRGAPQDGSAWQLNCDKDKIRVLRGGSWFDDAANSRSAIRDSGRPVYRIDGVGFRVARTLP